MNAKTVIDKTMELGKLLSDQDQLQKHLAYNNRRFIKAKRAGQHGQAAVFDKIMTEDLRVWRGRHAEIEALRAQVNRQSYRQKHITASGHLVRL